MRRTVATLLLVAVVAVPATLAAVPLAAGTAAATPSIDPGGSSRGSDDARITGFETAGRGMVVDQASLVEDHRGPPFVWASESLRIRPTVRTDPTARTRRACARLQDDGEVVETVECRTWNSSSGHERATMELSQWPAGVRGTHRIVVDLYEAPPGGANGTDGADGGDGTNGTHGADGADGGSELVRRDRRSVRVHVIGKQGDLDDDGLANAREVAEGTDFTRADTDGDGLSDRAEVYQYGSDPLSTDTTGDGIEDGTTASLRLPPTVPYAIHAVAVLLLFGAASLAYAASRLRRVLESGRGAATGWAAAASGGGETVAAGDAGDGDGGLGSTKEGEILAVVEEHGGRMRQAALVDETEWSKATVSRLLSTLEDDGRVEKIRVGRGNVVRLTEGAPDGERSRLSG